MKKAYCYELPLGRVLIAENETGISDLRLIGDRDPIPSQMFREETVLIRQAADQLLEYLNGERTEFSVLLSPEGTEFQLKVWNALKTIPYGTTTTYREIAEKIGSPTAYRAIGAANGKNPIWIMLPCHRVIASDGSLSGYAGGVEVKKKLLLLEGCPETWKESK